MVQFSNNLGNEAFGLHTCEMNTQKYCKFYPFWSSYLQFVMMLMSVCSCLLLFHRTPLHCHLEVISLLPAQDLLLGFHCMISSHMKMVHTTSVSRLNFVQASGHRSYVGNPSGMVTCLCKSTGCFALVEELGEGGEVLESSEGFMHVCWQITPSPPFTQSTRQYFCFYCDNIFPTMCSW
jgi:hypothetical protein